MLGLIGLILPKTARNVVGNGSVKATGGIEPGGLFCGPAYVDVQTILSQCRRKSVFQA